MLQTIEFEQPFTSVCTNYILLLQV